jgi:ATP-dependent Clp protease ATP-binding subunit ClpC
MEFLVWHYTKGVEYYLNSWFSVFGWVYHYFSPPLLLRSLFAPWKRLVIVDRQPGFNFSRWFQNFTFNLVSRMIGAIVRFILFFAGMIIIIMAFLGGVAGFVFWLTMPVFSLPVFDKYKNQPINFVAKITSEIKEKQQPPLKLIFANSAGRFVAQHLGITVEDLIQEANDPGLDYSNIKAQNYSDLIRFLVEGKVWSDSFYRKHLFSKDDFVLAASWWDSVREAETRIESQSYKNPGLGMELMFGYTPYLSQYSTNLSAPQSFAHHLIGREETVSQIERTLTAGQSVALVGPPGVGRKTVVFEFAHRAIQGQFGAQMAYRRVYEFDYNYLLAEAADLNRKKTNLAQVLEEASVAGNIIIMFRDLHRLTNAEVEGYDFTDIFEEYLGKRDLKIISVSTPQEYERFISPNMRLRKYLEKVEIKPPLKEEALEILIEAAREWEEKRKITLTVPALRKMLDESDRYISETPFPEKVLELLDSLVVYLEQTRKNVATITEVDKILAEKTGISFARLTKSEQKLLGKLEEIIHKRLINQDSAVKLIAKSLRARTVGVSKSDRPLGSFLFLGPTGVGKTETAKVLANVYYGSEEEIIRFDMAEYAGAEGLERLIGSVYKNMPGALTTAIKNKPASLLLLDEIEKASTPIFNLFLSLLDEGVMTDAFDRKVNGRHLFVIGTSNAGAEYIRQLVKEGVKGEEMQKKVIEYVLEKQIFAPEFINRFDGVVVYEPLTREHLQFIAKLMLKDLAKNLKMRGIKLEITDEAAAKLAEDGYDPAFGARPMRRVLNLAIGDAVGKAILDEVIGEGDTIKIIPGEAKEEYGVEKVQQL